MSPTPEITVLAFYRFAAIAHPEALREAVLAHCSEAGIRGTVLIATEGVNGTVAGPTGSVSVFRDWLASHELLVGIRFHEASAESIPFKRLKVKRKRDIVTFRVDDLDAANETGTYVEPRDWNALLDDPDVVVIDTRNDFEVALGSFPGALNPGTTSFSELPDWLAAEKCLEEKPKVAMFCTGGIRCEKSTALLKSWGFPEVYHLKGGILGYLRDVKGEDSRWEGECFVFDERLSVRNEEEG